MPSKLFTPFSNNIIFFDSEFSSMDPYVGEILSIGMVTYDGREMYLELEHNGKVSDWVKENILPTLTTKKVSRDDAVKKIYEFVGVKKPYLIAYVDVYDVVYSYKLFGDMKETPFNWMPLDFASMLFALGINPKSYQPKNKENFFDKLGVDTAKYHIHHALDDAKLLREVYLKLLEKSAK